MLKNIITISTLLFSIAAYSAEYVPGEVIVRLKKSASVSKYAGISEIYRSELKVMKVDESKDVFETINELALDPDVEFAQPNYIYRISVAPHANLWGLNNTGQAVTHTALVTNERIYASDTSTSGIAGDDIDGVSAWGLFNDCSSIIVAVIDTGIKYDHADLIANMWTGPAGVPNHGWNYTGVGTANDPMDNCGHGTHVAGIIGSSNDAGTGVMGVCRNVKLMAIKAFKANGSATTAAIIAGTEFAITNGANIINASFNIYDYDSAFSAEVTAAKAAGILFVSAAGNGDGAGSDGYNIDAGTQTYPCGFTQDNVLCVAALDQSFARASFSNYGSTSVDVAAPGTNIYSTWCNTAACDGVASACGSLPGVGPGPHGLANYIVENGTSMATPYAAGLAALVWANNPSFTYIDVKNAVMFGGTAVPSMSGVSVSGNVINAANALDPSLYIINSPTGLAATAAK